MQALGVCLEHSSTRQSICRRFQTTQETSKNIILALLLTFLIAAAYFSIVYIYIVTIYFSFLLLGAPVFICKERHTNCYVMIMMMTTSESPDSDVFFILLHYALTLKDATGTGNKQRLINITELAEDYTQSHCTALMCLHA